MATAKCRFNKEGYVPTSFVFTVLLAMTAADLAAMVRELRCVASEAPAIIRDAAKWALACGVRTSASFDSATLGDYCGWGELAPSAQRVLGSAVSKATAVGVAARIAPKATHLEHKKRGRSCGAAEEASVERTEMHEVMGVVTRRMEVEPLPASSSGPTAAIRALVRDLDVDQLSAWAERAKLEALCGSSKKSLREAASALRCWAKFAVLVLGLSPDSIMPPSVDGLLQWSRAFAVKETFRNYVGKIRLACELMRLSTASLDHPSIKRAMATIRTLSAAPRAKHYTRRCIVGLLVGLAKSENDLASAMLYLVSYAFLLRVPSEALPVTLGCKGEKATGKLAVGVHSDLSMSGSRVRLQLARRKHKPHGSVMHRSCWCDSCKITCPVHNLAPLLRHPDAVGRQPFLHISPSRVNQELRRRLLILGIDHAPEYDTRCFRRGHAEDLAHGSSRLHEILEAGEWSSSRFKVYLDAEGLQDAAVKEAHACPDHFSDSE